MKELNTFRKFLTEEEEEEGNKIPEAALILPRGEKIILQAEEQDYKRGLIVELTDEGGYKINYWYGDDVKVYPAEVEVDGVSIKDDANEVYIKFHPELAEGRMFDGKEIGVGNIINMVMKDMDAKELGVEDGNEYLDKMIGRLKELKINLSDYGM